MRPTRRSCVLALALVPIGTLGGHLVGYGLAGVPAGLGGSHGHLRPAAWLASVAAVAALGWVAGTSGARHASVRLGWLAAGQAALFVALEGAEHAVAGNGLSHLLAEPALRWGLAAQVVTAAVLVLAAVVARHSGARVRSLLAGRHGHRRPPATAVASAAVAAVVRSLLLATPASPRGPPPALVPV